jgi:DNA-binding transcriptional regulator YiaG
MRDEPESDILFLVHKVVAGLHQVGLANEATMREFDLMCLPIAKRPNLVGVRSLRRRGQNRKR